MGGGGKSAHDLLKDDKLSSEVGMEPAAKRRRKEGEEEEEDDVIEHASVPQDQEVDLGSIKDKLSKKKDNKSKKAKQGAN